MDVILLPLVFLVGAAVGAFLAWLTLKIKPTQQPMTEAQLAQSQDRLVPGPFIPPQ